MDRAGRHTATALARAGDDPDILFRAALVAELSGNRDLALERLRRAIEKGYPQHMIAGEPDLLALRRDRRYHGLLPGEQR
jgi:serine/threonine-protein kinase